MLDSEEPAFILEAHNGLSAKIGEEAGFSGLWGSGLAISASMGVRDSNEASWTQVLETVEFMTESTTVPLLLDGDTGYGNFNNVRRLVSKLEQRDVAGVCLEDKLFPKTNSFINGDLQPLADVKEFSGKIRAAKDAQRDPDFCVVARVEALIAGQGHDEALRRADAYREAGADAILIHSKRSTAEEILRFCQSWDNACPVVVVPTMYSSTPTQTLVDAGISLIIWANHMVRSSIGAMQQTAAEIFEAQSVQGVESSIVGVAEIFRLQNVNELKEAEKRYLPQTPG